jgi:hypothetical protein
VAAYRHVTRNQILLFPQLFSSCGAYTRADGPVHQPDSLAGHAPDGIVKTCAAGFFGISPNMFSGKKKP